VYYCEARFDVLRETAVILRREGLNIDTLLESIRLKQFLDEIGLKGEKLEDFAKDLDIHCFKRGLTPDTFMNLELQIYPLFRIALEFQSRCCQKVLTARKNY
jgi:hypothetical protein